MTPPDAPTSPPTPETSAFLLRWRGKQEGPLKLEELERRIAANDIGLLHEIQFEEEWIPLRKFLELRAARSEAERLRREEAGRRDREREEREAREREARQREELLAEEKRKNDLLEAAVRGQQGSAPSGLPFNNMMAPAKSRGTYIILGLLLGTLGIHNFYAGYYGRGAVQVIITLTLGLATIGLGLVVTALWALIEICVVTEDANGTRMT